MQVQLESSQHTRQTKQRPQRRKRDVFDEEEPQTSQLIKRQSSQEKYKQQIVNIDQDEEEAVIGVRGSTIVVNVNMLTAQKEAIIERNKTTNTHFVKNIMYYGQEVPEYELVSSPHLNHNIMITHGNSQQNIPRSMGQLIIEPSKPGNKVIVREAGDEENQEEVEEKKTKASKAKRRTGRQVFDSDQEPEQPEQPELPTEPGEITPPNRTKQKKEQPEQPNALQPPQKTEPLPQPSPPTEPAIPSSSVLGNLYAIQIQSETDLKYFFYKALPKGTIMQCQIRRFAQGLQTRYQLYLDDMRPLMCAQSRASVGCNMHISMNRDMDRHSKYYLGKLRSNLLGSMYSVYGAGENPKSTKSQKEWRSLLANVQYENNFMGLKGPRRILTKIPTVQAQFPENLYKVSDDQTFWNLQSKYPGSVMTFKNRQPRWNQRLKSYALNFGGRVKQASIKNFILVEYDPALERVGFVNTLIFGKISQTKFSLEFTHPFSPLQAFCIALSSFDSKLNCQ